MMRVFTTLLLAVVVLTGIWYLASVAVQAIILCAIAIGLWEFSKLVFPEKVTALFTTFTGTALASYISFCYPQLFFKPLLLPILICELFLCFVWVMKYQTPQEESIHRAGLIFLGTSYLALTLPVWGWIHYEFGKEWVLLALFPTCLTDTFGFLVGKAIGRHKLAPVVSPNKTLEGAIGSLFGATFGLWLANRLFFDPLLQISWPLLFGLGFSIGLVAIFGDLIESLIKRSVKVKDSSHLIPGHGGALDRLDALTFSAPFFYFVVIPLIKP